MNELHYLINYMIKENESLRLLENSVYDFNTYRALSNIREAKPIDSSFLDIQDHYLQSLKKERHITTLNDLKEIHDHIYLWQGDITSLKVDAIVNAANSGMTGCYSPCHGCIDNAIHTYAGVQLRLECADIIHKQGYLEETGQAKITSAYNLPCSYVLHTVGPIIYGALTDRDCELLKNCYLSCLTLAKQHNIRSIAFCCISTGEFHFPNKEAAKIAIQTVKEFLSNQENRMEVIFNVFKEEDLKIYRDLLGSDQ